MLGYGLAVWLGMVGISLILLPAEGKHEALYESVKLTTMVALVLGLAIRYLRRRPMATGSEGVLVGLVWAAVTTAGDLGLYLGGAFNIGLDVYFTDVASSYSVMPVITGLAIGLLAPKPTGILSADAYGAALVGAQPAGPSDADEFAAMMAAAAPAEPAASPAATASETPAATETHPVTETHAVTETRTVATAESASGADASSGTQTGSELHAESAAQAGPEIHAAPEAAAAPVVPSPAAASHAEATLVGAAVSAQNVTEDTDRPLYIPRGNC
ncbi:hypothetical protein GCM10009662_69510 [Catellatospora coxensis]|uniref:Uncharacterized protein n=1 Tax=Catellatospora coxensis TaxID=310354 RepID=A0A8J3L3A4_9ACTN|nr:hypothetical protein Cco03nite_79720 [Catellatospora coxensis]